MSRDVQVLASPHPFTTEKLSLAVKEGETIAQILARVQPRAELRQNAIVFLGDGYVPPQYWHAVRPRAGVTLTVRLVPGNGKSGGENLRAVLTIIVIAAAMWVTGGGAATQSGWFAAGSFSAAVAGVAVGVAGMYLVNQIAPPPTPELGSLSDDDESQTYSVTGGRNVLNPWGAVPMVLGRHRITPPLAARPYTEIAGADQYLHQIFVTGYGPQDLSEHRIGETLIYDPATGEENFTDVNLVTVGGRTGDGVPAGFTDDIYEEQLSVLLEQAAGWSTRTTQPNTDEISIDITFPQGLVSIDSEGDKNPVTVAVHAEYRLVGAATWNPMSAGIYHAARNQPFVVASSTAYNPDNVEEPLYTYCIYRVVIDSVTGEISVLKGAFAVSPVAPAVPSRKLKICQFRSDVLRPVPTDERDSFLTAPDPTAFAPSQASADGNVAIGAGTLTAAILAVTAATATAVRRNTSIRVARGQYEVRVSRSTADSTSDTVIDKVYWSALRSITDTVPVTLDGVALAGLDIKATDQLSGVVDTYNCVAELMCQDWDRTSQTWVERGTSNPASLFRWLLQGPANKRPVADARLDLTTLQEWHEWCHTNQKTFNAVFDNKRTLRELLALVAAAGRASPVRRDGLYSVVVDKARTEIAQFFTPRNTRNYRGSKIFTKQLHGLKIRYVDAAIGWRQAERIVYADGYSESNATEFEELDFFGVTSADQVWRDGRYHLAVLQLRPEQHTFECDIEHLRCTRGDLIRFNHDVPLAGLTAGRVKRVIANGAPTADTTYITGDTTVLRVNDEGLIIELDQLVPMVAGTSYGIRFRFADGSSAVYTVDTEEGEFPIIRAGSGTVAPAPAAGDLFMFGELGSDSIELLVTRIEPLSDLGARITAVDYAPAVYTADTGTIPAYDPQITVPPEMQIPATPIVDNVRSDESVLIRNNDGSLTTRVLITLGRRPTLAALLPPTLEVQIRPTNTGPFVPATAAGIESQEVSVTDVEDGSTYDIRLRYVSIFGLPSPWVTITETVIGKTSNPPDIAALYYENPYVVWRYETPPRDLAGFRVRFHAGSRTTWDDANPAHDGLVSESKFDTRSIAVGGTVTILAKAVDITGRESVNAATLIKDLGDPLIENIILTNDYKALSWPGTVVNGTTLLGDLVADAAAVFWSGTDTSPFWTGVDAATFWSTSYLAMTYTASYTPAAAEVGAKLTLTYTIEGVGWFIDYRIDSGPWKPWPGQVIAEDATYQFRVTTLAGTTQGAIRAFQLDVDVPDIVESFENVALAATTGTRLTLSETYASILHVSGITIQGTTTAIKVIVVDKNATLGPLLQAIDGTGAVVAATVDVTRVQGY